MQQYSKTMSIIINFDYVAKENIKELCPQISDHPYRLLIIVGSRSGKKINYLI